MAVKQKISAQDATYFITITYFSWLHLFEISNSVPAESSAGDSASIRPLVTFYPTFLQMAGMPLMPEQHKDGVSLAPLLEGKKSIDQPAIYWHYPHYSNQGGGPGAAIRENNWKLVQFYDDNHVELYDLRADIEERRDLSYTLPGRTADMLHLFNFWKKLAGAKMPAINPYYNPDYKELMKKNNENIRQYLSHYDTLFSKGIYDSNVSEDLRERYDRLYHNKN